MGECLRVVIAVDRTYFERRVIGGRRRRQAAVGMG